MWKRNKYRRQRQRMRQQQARSAQARLWRWRRRQQQRPRGLHIGVNYPRTQHALQGCVHDALDMQTACQHRWPRMVTQVLRDDKPDAPPRTRATLWRILWHLRQLARLSHRRWGPRLFVITFSGHGVQVRNRNAAQDAETDGLDEAWLCADDLLLTDDVLHAVLGTFHPRARVLVVTDACHSGTMSDIYSGFARTDAQHAYQHHVRCQALHISGCKDDDVSMEVYQHEQQRMGGALTNALTAHWLLRPRSHNRTWQQVAQRVHHALRAQALTQVPQFSYQHVAPRDRPW